MFTGLALGILGLAFIWVQIRCGGLIIKAINSIFKLLESKLP